MDFYNGYENGNEYGSESFGSMEERMLERRAEKLYRSLSEKGEFAKLDKAKRNSGYRNYLLENMEDEF